MLYGKILLAFKANMVHVLVNFDDIYKEESFFEIYGNNSIITIL